MRCRDKHAFLLKNSAKIHTYVFYDTEQVSYGLQSAIFYSYRDTAREERYREKHAFLFKNSEKIHTYVFFDAEQVSYGLQSDIS